jgi:hypothetical protein
MFKSNRWHGYMAFYNGLSFGKILFVRIWATCNGGSLWKIVWRIQ